VRRAIRMMAALDGASVRISLPQDPGQAGKLQARDMIKMLAGYRVRAQIESGSKEVRAEPFAAMCAGGCVKIVKTGDPAKDAWIEPYIAELLAFPGSPVKDQVDASSSAFLALQSVAQDNRNGDIGGPPISTGVEYGSQNSIDDIGRNPDADQHSYPDDRDESNDGFGDGDGFTVRGSLF
jgi:predicted phage terminase large subunit-like protein